MLQELGVPVGRPDLHAGTPFVEDRDLTLISVAYRNNSLIGDQVLPRTAVAEYTFGWTEFPLTDAYTLPDTRIGRKSEPNMVEFGSIQKSGIIEDFGLDDFIPARDLSAATAAHDPRGVATETLTALISLSREVRVAGLVFANASYPASQKMALAGSSQFSDAASDPIGVFQAGLDGCMLRPNTLVLGFPVWQKLRTHPRLIKAVGNVSGEGAITRKQLADLLEIGQVLVGEGYINAAPKGLTSNMQRVWGKHAALLYLDPSASARSPRPTFGMTFEYDRRTTYAFDEPKRGARPGGTTIRVVESVREQIIAPHCGFFIENAVA